jgi:H+/Cl- antiporter ClcA
MVDYVFGTILAFLCAVAAILVDCHVALTQRLKRVPIAVLKTPEAWVLCIVCGVVAGIAYHFTSNQGNTFLDAVLGLDQKNPVLRGACVGLTVLVLIRSKVFALKGADVGGEYFYDWGRSWVMQSINTNCRRFHYE